MFENSVPDDGATRDEGREDSKPVKARISKVGAATRRATTRVVSFAKEHPAKVAMGVVLGLGVSATLAAHVRNDEAIKDLTNRADDNDWFDCFLLRRVQELEDRVEELDRWWW